MSIRNDIVLPVQDADLAHLLFSRFGPTANIHLSLPSTIDNLDCSSYLSRLVRKIIIKIRNNVFDPKVMSWMALICRSCQSSVVPKYVP